MTAPLTREQKIAGREFRDRCTEMLAALEAAFPAGAHCPPFTIWFRHTCGTRGSWALFLRQHLRYDPDAVFAFSWREAVCPRCGLSVRSSGRLSRASGTCQEKGAVVAAH